MILWANERLRVVQAGEGCAFVTEVNVKGHWRAASLPCHPLAGAAEHDAAALRWRADYASVGSGVLVTLKLTVLQPVLLNPSIILWLGTLDNLDDRQAHTWRSTILRAPTQNQQGLGGNDLPAGYYYDHAQKTETFFYVDASTLGWTPHRFYELAVREVCEYEPTPRYGFGLVRTVPQTHQPLPPGEYCLRWWFAQRPCDTPPSPWEAQRRLIAAVGPLLDDVPSLPPDAPGWNEMAQRALDDLHDDACWTTGDAPRGLRAYVKGSSRVARDEQHGYELMTQLDVLWPLLLWGQVTGSEPAAALAERLVALLPLYDRPALNYVANAYPPHSDDSFMDTWYFLENALIKLPWVAYLTGSDTLRAMFLRAREGAETLVRNTHGLLPLFANASDWGARQSVLNMGVGGLYAAGCVLAAQLDPARAAHYLSEAEQALAQCLALPPHMLTHEPQQLTFAAAAAAYLAQHSPNLGWAVRAADFVKLSLRMGYWARDSRETFYDARGMFQACASLCYPAYKENVETLLAWPELLAGDTSALPVRLMASWANLQRCHNYAFFDPWLPREHHTPYGRWIPHENVATHELNHSATFGKEIYGAGEVFWSALMFDTMGRVSDDDILCLSLDVPCLTLRRMPTSGTRFLLYNPSARQRSTRLIRGMDEMAVTLAPNTAQFITMEV
jgi:hypothetical protein